MITARDLITKLEDVMDMLTSDYAPAQWDAKKEIDVARYKAAKKVYEEADDAICSCDIDWDNCSEENIIALIEKLSCEITMMEEDLGIEA